MITALIFYYALQKQIQLSVTSQAHKILFCIIS